MIDNTYIKLEETQYLLPEFSEALAYEDNIVHNDISLMEINEALDNLKLKYDNKFTRDELQKFLQTQFPQITDEVANAIVETLFSPQIRTDNGQRIDRVPDDVTISFHGLKTVLEEIANIDDNPDAISFEEISNVENWGNIARYYEDGEFYIWSIETVQEAFKNSNYYEVTEEKISRIFDDVIEEEFDISNYRRIEIDNTGMYVAVPPEEAELVESLLNNSEEFKESALKSISQSGENTLYILDSPLPFYTLGEVALKPTTDSGIATQAIMEINFSRLNDAGPLQGLYARYKNPTQPDWFALTEEEKEIIQEQYKASVIIHELGHIDGSLGTHEKECDCFTWHGPEHSQYIGGIFSEWIQNTGQTSFFNIEEADYSQNSFFDRVDVLAKNIPGKNTPTSGSIFPTLGSIFYAIQDAIFSNDYATANSLISSIPQDMIITQRWSNPQTKEENFRTISAREYIAGLLLYETIDTYIGGSDGLDKDNAEKTKYVFRGAENENYYNYNQDNLLFEKIAHFYNYAASEENKILFQTAGEVLGLDDNLENYFSDLFETIQPLIDNHTSPNVDLLDLNSVFS